MRHIEALLWHIESYSDKLKALCNPCMYNCAIFRTLAYLEPEVFCLSKMSDDQAYSEPWHNTQKSLFKHFEEYLLIFRDIDSYLATVRHYSFSQCSIVSVWQCSEHASAYCSAIDTVRLCYVTESSKGFRLKFDRFYLVILPLCSSECS